MNKRIILVKYAILAILVSIIFIYGLAVLDTQLIAIIIGLCYIVFWVISKTTKVFTKNLFLIRYEKTLAIIVVLTIAIIQVTINELKPAVPILLMGFNVLALGYLTFSWVHEKVLTIRKLKVEKLEAELQLLKHQINPHFFFNTLNNLYGLALEKADATPDYIQKLSELMRYVIDQGANEQVSIDDEVSYLNNYLELQLIRYHVKPNVELTVDLQNERMKLAPLLLTNLVENAFKHGLDVLREGAFLKISLRCTPEEFWFTIENNFLEQKKEGSSGVGLENLRRRLELIYPNAHKLDINKSEGIFHVALNINFTS